MNSKGKIGAPKGDAKGVSRHRPPKGGDRPKTPGDDAVKKPFFGRRTAEAHPKRPQVSSAAPSVQKKTPMVAATTTSTTNTSWVKGGSSLSFADVVRRKTENGAPGGAIVHQEPLSHDVVAETVLLVEDNDVELTNDAQESAVVVVVNNTNQSLENVCENDNENDNEDIPCAAVHQDTAIIEAVIPTPLEEELEETHPKTYYVLEIDRMPDESVNLPQRIMTGASGYMGAFTFSGQPGKPPTPPAATQIQQQFYRPETAALRSFSGMGSGAPDVNRGQHWAPHSGHPIEYANANWTLQERGQRGFNQVMQYNSYPAQVQQHPQRNFIAQTVNRVPQNEAPDVPLSRLREPAVFNRHPGTGGGVW